MLYCAYGCYPFCDDDRAEADEGKSLQLLLDEELQRLVRRRDELKVSVARHRDFVMSNAVQEIGIDLADLSRSISSNGAAIVRLEAEKLELEDELAKYSTEQIEYKLTIKSYDQCVSLS